MNLKSKKFHGTVPGQLTSVKVNEGDISTALRLWKKQLKDCDIIQQCYDRKAHVKPSDRKRLQLEIAKYNQSKEQMEI